MLIFLTPLYSNFFPLIPDLAFFRGALDFAGEFSNI